MTEIKNLSERIEAIEDALVAAATGDLSSSLIEKVAIIGLTPPKRVVVKIAMMLLGVGKRAKYCRSEEEALAWLAEPLP